MHLPIEELTPRQIVGELDRYIVGQPAAKRSVAVALRNRYRRQQLPVSEREDILPKNILMIGPTGVGKTEIARRLAQLALYDSDYALVVGREAQRAKIPFVTSGATLPGLTKQIGEYAFAACYGDDDQARAMAEFALKHLKRKDALVAIDRRHAYTRTVGDDFAQAFGKRGVAHKLDAKDSKGLRERLSSKVKIGVFYAACLPEDAVAAVRLVRKHVWIPILSGDGFDTPDLWTTPGLDTRGVYFTTHVAYNAPDTLVQEFVRRYHQRYGKVPESAAAALAFDSLGLVAEANRRRGKSTLRDAIARTKKFPWSDRRHQLREERSGAEQADHDRRDRQGSSHSKSSY